MFMKVHQIVLFTDWASWDFKNMPSFHLTFFDLESNNRGICAIAM